MHIHIQLRPLILCPAVDDQPIRLVTEPFGHTDNISRRVVHIYIYRLY